jgi:hypothetical protein
VTNKGECLLYQQFHNKNGIIEAVSIIIIADVR